MGEKTIEIRSKTTFQPEESQLTLFCSWFCPYAQRAWIAMETKNLKYKYEEINPYEPHPDDPNLYTKKSLSIDKKREKYPQFVKASPKGLVPAINFDDPKEREELIAESLVCVEYIDEKFKEGPSLLPTEPYLRARIKFWVEHINSKIIQFYYKMLMNQVEEEQEKAKQECLKGLKELGAAIIKFDQEVTKDKHNQKFLFNGEFGIADISLAPWWQRMEIVAKHYRGFEVPNDCEEFRRLHDWFKDVLKVPGFSNTLVNADNLIKNYSGYADNSATSEVAKQTRNK